MCPSFAVVKFNIQVNTLRCLRNFSHYYNFFENLPQMRSLSSQETAKNVTDYINKALTGALLDRCCCYSFASGVNYHVTIPSKGFHYESGAQFSVWSSLPLWKQTISERLTWHHCLHCKLLIVLNPFRCLSRLHFILWPWKGIFAHHERQAINFPVLENIELAFCKRNKTPLFFLIWTHVFETIKVTREDIR